MLFYDAGSRIGRVAEMVTAFARVKLIEMKEIANKQFGMNIIYDTDSIISDTDSIYAKTNFIDRYLSCSLFLIANNASNPIRDITNLLSTVNLTLAIPGNHSLLKMNDTRRINTGGGFIELHVKKFVNGGGSTIRLAVCCHNVPMFTPRLVQFMQPMIKGAQSCIRSL